MPSTFKNLLKLAKNTIKQGIKVSNSRPNAIKHFNRTFITKHPIKLIKPFQTFHQKLSLTPFQSRTLSYLNKKNNFLLKNLTNNSGCLTLFFKKHLVTYKDLNKEKRKIYESFSKLTKKLGIGKEEKPEYIAKYIEKLNIDADSDNAIKELSTKYKLVTYDKLGARQRCIYDSFTNLDDVKDDAESMALYVNSNAIDADSDEAVIILSKKYGLSPKYGAPGALFQEVRLEPKDGDNKDDFDEEAIFVITDATVADDFKQRFGNEFSGGVTEILGFEPTNRNTGKKKDFIWHAVYAKAGRARGGEVIRFVDPQNSRPNGPTNTDYFVYFSNK